MKLRELMTKSPVRLHPDENAAVAARAFQRYNIGAVPVCGAYGRICGILTDRDLVTRCVAAGMRPEDTKVSQVMSGSVVTVGPDMEVAEAAKLMAQRQVRRLPVVQGEKLCGMVSIGDLADKGAQAQVAEAMGSICSNISKR